MEFKNVTFMRHHLKRHASYFQFESAGARIEGCFYEWVVQREWRQNRQTKANAGVAEAIRIIQAKVIFVGLAERFDYSMVLLKALMANDLNISYSG